MKNHTTSQFLTILMVMMCSLFALPQRVHAKYPYAYAQLNEKGNTLTFYYDDKAAERPGKKMSPNDVVLTSWIDVPRWAGTYSERNTSITTVVFDESFKQARPTTIAGWFHYLEALTTLKGLENLNTSEVTDMRGLFCGCKSLLKLDLSTFNTSKVTEMSGMFQYCSNLQEVNLSSFNTAKVTRMISMFSGCNSLKALDLSSFNTSEVTMMIEMFQECTALTKLDLSNFVTTKVSNFTQMFHECKNLKELDLSQFTTSENANLQSVFAMCRSLETIKCNNTWKGANDIDLFFYCRKLKGAVPFDDANVGLSMANPETGYFTKKKPTGLSSLWMNSPRVQGVYTLQGKRVVGNVQNLPAGAYIVTGKVEIR